MAFSSNGGNGFGRGRYHGAGALAEINIIPLVDVVLVLLVIFMLTAHVMEFGLEVDVPKVKQTRDTAQELPVVTITRDGETYLNDQPVNINLLATQIQSRFGKTKAVYLRADKGSTWDPIAQVMAALGDAGFQVNAVTQPEESAGKRP